MNPKLRIIAAIMVIVHAVIAIFHGISHGGAGVALSFFGYSYVSIVVFLAPLLALLLLNMRLVQWGAWLLFFAMLGSFVYGVSFHFILLGSDNMTQVPLGAWNLPFQWSAVLLAISEAIGVGVGIWTVYEMGRRPAQQSGKQT